MTSLRPLTPKQKNRRARILTATRKLVTGPGYDGMVMSKVAELANVSPTTLYNLYNTKDELLLEALRELLVKHYQKVDDRSAGERGWQYLMTVVENGALLRLSEPAYGKAIVDALLRAVPGDALTQLLLENLRQDFHDSLNSMEERGELQPDVDTEHLSTLLLGNYWSTFILLNKGVERTARIKCSLEINFLSILLAATRGTTRRELERRLAEARAKEEAFGNE